MHYIYIYRERERERQRERERKRVNSTGNSFMTLKDNSNDFLNHSTTRLLNPAKNVIGRINKDIL